jgi:hypothetical protein
MTCFTANLRIAGVVHGSCQIMQLKAAAMHQNDVAVVGSQQRGLMSLTRKASFPHIYHVRQGCKRLIDSRFNIGLRAGARKHRNTKSKGGAAPRSSQAMQTTDQVGAHGPAPPRSPRIKMPMSWMNKKMNKGRSEQEALCRGNVGSGLSTMSPSLPNALSCVQPSPVVWETGQGCKGDGQHCC